MFKGVERVLLTHITPLQVDCYPDLQEAGYEIESETQMLRISLSFSPLITACLVSANCLFFHLT